MAQVDSQVASSTRVKLVVLMQASFLFVALTLSFRFISCEPKEFDWSELGVSLTGPRSTYNGSNNNLRILLSPQRRMTSKSYEIDYSNHTSNHPAFGEASYVIPGSGGSSAFATQPGSHNSAYSALSASLASLKNRLNARSAVSLGAQLAEVNSQQSGLYQGSAGSYGSPSSSDSQQQHQQHSTQTQSQNQPTYLSLSHPDQQSASGYGAVQNQSSDNKTIVLAIPAKINFLTDGRTPSTSSSSSGINNKQLTQLQPQQLTQQQQQQQQPQQVTVIHQTAGGEQALRPEYSAAGGVQDGSTITLDQATASAVGQDQQDQHHQYVIVNSSPTHASSPVSTSHQTNEHVTHYQSVYQPAQIQQQTPVTVKYIPTYQPVAAVQPKIYAPLDHQTSAYSDAQPASDLQMYGRYSCLDTCNSGDIRWRKYTVSKYKYCCSRSAQYDPQFLETPSAEKLGESAKQADDAYYNYLYRRTRARRSRRPSQRYLSQYPRYNRYGSGSTASATDDDSTVSNEGRSRLYESPYMKYYKSRQPQQQDAPETSRDVHDSSVTIPSGKYPSSKERSYRRGRARDFDPQQESTQPGYDALEDEGTYSDPSSSRSVGYGSGDYATGDSGRNSPNEGRSEDDEGRSGYPDDSLDTEVAPGKGSADVSSDYQSDLTLDHQQNDDASSEQDSAPTYKYSANRKRKSQKSRQRKVKYGKQESKYYGKKNGRKMKHGKQEQLSSQMNGTDYESTNSNGGQSNSEQYRTGSESSASDDDTSSTGTGESGNGEAGEGDKDSVSLANKFKSALNESTVVNLSKTTMHLKEILSMLEKKAHLRLNESSSSNDQQTSSTPSPVPMTTTNLYPYSFLGSQFNSPSLQALSSEYLTSELNLKSPYRFDTASHLGPSLTLPSTYNSGLGLDAYSSLPTFGSSHYSALPSQAKQLPTYSSAHPPQRKRRVNKNVRYNGLMLPKVQGPLQASLASYHGPSKYPFLSGGYYSAYYPYWYPRNTSPSITNAYPYRNKSSYSSLLNGPVSSKLAAAASSALHNEESRLHGSASYDPISNVASSLRPTSTMRLRKSLYQPHVLPPVYSRLAQPLDSTK